MPTVIVGLTGSIGMGKTTTANMFREMGVPIYDADAVVHQLYKSKPVITEIEGMFPGSTTSAGVDREKLGQIVLSNPRALKKLEAYIHPLVQNAEDEFLADARRRNVPLVVLDIPLLFENEKDGDVDKIVVVTAPAHIQRRRVLGRQGMTEDRFNAILNKQMPDEQKRSRADFIIDTSKGLDAARSQVSAIVDSLTCAS